VIHCMPLVAVVIYNA